MDADHGARDCRRPVAGMVGTQDDRSSRIVWAAADDRRRPAFDVDRRRPSIVGRDRVAGCAAQRRGCARWVDLAWRSKHFLGSPVQGASVATVNLAHVVAAVEFTVAEMAVNPGDKTVRFGDEIEEERVSRTEAVDAAN